VASNICQALTCGILTGGSVPDAIVPGTFSKSTEPDGSQGITIVSGGRGQGLTLDHFSAQLEPSLTQKHTLNIP
jgi:hypothetical protein